MRTFLVKSTLRIKINNKKKDMYAFAKQYGLTHPIVVNCSQELDALLNEYQDFTCNPSSIHSA